MNSIHAACGGKRVSRSPNTIRHRHPDRPSQPPDRVMRENRMLIYAAATLDARAA